MKKTIKVISLMLLLVVVSTATVDAQQLNARKHGTVKEQLEQANINNTRQDQIKEMLDYAFQFRGVRYRSGAAGPKGFDCSGFTSYVFKKFGYNLNRTSGGQIYDGEKVSRSDLQPGDLVFFNGRAIGRRIGHVGIVTEVNKEDNTFKFIHAACRTGITESQSDETYYRRRYMGACRVITEEETTK